ncbi:UDP-glucosyltransferase 2-like [Planococcus citri]|uniref:UDP-glucosyltransferase 2-like n=1 Tax=Planococcus citri TaxID=170843 RepID=UPI0031F9A3F3
MNVTNSSAFLLLLAFFDILISARSDKILGIFIIRSKSHHIINQAVMEGLHARGHEVTIISHFKSEQVTPNYTEILLSEEVQSFVDSVAVDDRVHLDGIMNEINLIYTLEKSSCDDVFSLDYIKRLIVNSEKKTIDLIIAEVYNIRCLHLLAHKLNVPLIAVSPATILSGVDYMIGNPYNPAVTPLLLSSRTLRMNFIERLQNALEYAVTYWYLSYMFNRDMETYARDVFRMDLPPEDELKRRTALVLYNNHFSFMARLKSPNAIDIAGIHIKEPNKLPKDIEDFIQASDDGVILFSFGSTIKASSMSEENLKIIVDTFSKVPQKFLWRVDQLNITEVPSNVKLGTWFPQRDILEHKNVIAFISHCGLIGSLEAIHTSTPVIGMPIMFDQFQNAKILVEHGIGIYVDYYNMRENTLLNAITEITINPKYKQNVQKLSDIFKDRPMSPLNETLYWTEYVLKHKGAPHLRPQSADMPLYQYVLLDVLAVLLGIIIAVMYLCKYSFKITFAAIDRIRTNEKKTPLS